MSWYGEALTVIWKYRACLHRRMRISQGKLMALLQNQAFRSCQTLMARLSIDCERSSIRHHAPSFTSQGGKIGSEWLSKKGNPISSQDGTRGSSSGTNHKPLQTNAKTNQFRYIWYNSEKILVRKVKRQHPFNINSEDGLTSVPPLYVVSTKLAKKRLVVEAFDYCRLGEFNIFIY